MLLRFRFSNFRSFKSVQELSLVAGPFTDLPKIVRHPSGIREGLLPLAAIYGANASGKTNVIRALEFMSSAVSFSYRSWQPDASIPRDPFLGDEESALAPSEFVADVLLDGVRHQYGFSMDSETILEEWLYVYPRGKKQAWFHRRHGHPTTFSSKMPGENRTIENLTRRNCLFLSAAAQNNHEALLPVFTWFTKALLFVVGDRGLFLHHTVRLCQAADYKNSVAKLVSAADLGISDLQVQTTKTSDELRKVIEAVYSVVKPRSGENAPVIPEVTSEITLFHRLGDKTLPLKKEQESAGTVAYLALLGPVVDALKKGAVLGIDELDASLHPLLAAQLMRLFNDPSSNPNGAQLIVNTHDANLLSSGVLRRDQIWFTEKNNDATSHLYPLSDFRPRRGESLQNGYLQGRYGAIPFINAHSFLAMLEANDGEG
jgi:AAA15 family ATPase/GTPase